MPLAPSCIEVVDMRSSAGSYVPSYDAAEFFRSFLMEEQKENDVVAQGPANEWNRCCM